MVLSFTKILFGYTTVFCFKNHRSQNHKKNFRIMDSAQSNFSQWSLEGEIVGSLDGTVMKGLVAVNWIL